MKHEAKEPIHRPRREEPTGSVFLLLLAALVAAGCGGDKSAAPTLGPRLAPSNVVEQLEKCYKSRDAHNYAALLADDFHFIPWQPRDTHDPPESWPRSLDSNYTSRLFAATDVKDVRVALAWAPDVPDNEVGHEGWRRIRVYDTFIEVDQEPPAGEILTLRVDGDVQDLFLRKGASPADTLATSETAQQWFLVEWHDLARLQAPAGPGGAEGPTPVQAMNWSAIKKNWAPEPR